MKWFYRYRHRDAVISLYLHHSLPHTWGYINGSRRYTI